MLALWLEHESEAVVKNLADLHARWFPLVSRCMHLFRNIKRRNRKYRLEKKAKTPSN